MPHLRLSLAAIRAIGAFAAIVLLAPLALAAIEPSPEIHITRAAGAISIDGDLGDPGWRGVPRLETFYETKRSDNGPPPAATAARLAYDDRYFYAAFEFSDPNPRALRAPLGDHDDISGDTDYGGIILDTRHDGKSAILFLANPANVQYDAVTNDASGEDPSPDYFWDSATRITTTGWVLEMRIPFSSLRYGRADPQTWGIILYRNYPRDFHYQMFSVRLPRGSNCFICHENPLTGLAGLPPGGHLVVAPYGNGKWSDDPVGDVGTPLAAKTRADGGVDVKWTPSPNHAVDATLNPDFSQIESDTAQISANQRFALFYPEKRPFFLEGSDLFATPLQAVYTRTVTSPRWGARATGRLGEDNAYTFLVAEDRGGGSAILPGPAASSLVNEDFASTVAIGRFRRDLGSSFASFLTTDRESAGGVHNRVVGPDFRWQPGDGDSVTGQFLYSDSRTPNLPALATEWDGRRLSGHAADLQWSHSRTNFDFFFEGKDIGDGFRADSGFLPQVGIREASFESGSNRYPQGGFFSRLRPFLIGDHVEDTSGRLVLNRPGIGIGADGKLSSFARVIYQWERVLAAGRIVARPHVDLQLQVTPGLRIGAITLTGFVGDDVDLVDGRRGHGGLLTLTSVVRPTDHLQLAGVFSRRWLDVPAAGGEAGGRQLWAAVDRLKATYTFTPRTFVRLIGQRATVDPRLALYRDPANAPAKEDDRTLSALFAYKLNWQTVMFLGYGDERALSDAGLLRPAGRTVFLKLSYAYQL
ncbi:MAG TPA: DUF5916 domain-containing protein [Thermoanaerobaculia bacterium]